jgi:hypothetical protein
MGTRKKVNNRDHKVRVFDWSNTAWLRHIVRTCAKLDIDMSTDDGPWSPLADESRALHNELNVKGRIEVCTLQTGM